jgi:hypothetical protein
LILNKVSKNINKKFPFFLPAIYIPLQIIVSLNIGDGEEKKKNLKKILIKYSLMGFALSFFLCKV